MKRIFTYLQYKTKDGATGTFFCALDADKIREQAASQFVISETEQHNLVHELVTCLALLDKGVESRRLFENSALSPELAASFLTCSSANIDLILNHPLPAGSCMHILFWLKVDPKAVKHKVNEAIYPGPDSVADDAVIGKWLETRTWG